jgi:hypothetical protein
MTATVVLALCERLLMCFKQNIAQPPVPQRTRARLSMAGGHDALRATRLFGQS